MDLVTIMLTLSVAVLIVILRDDIDPEVAGLGLLCRLKQLVTVLLFSL